MSDIIAPIVADTDELSSGDNNAINAGPLQDNLNGPINTISDQNGGTPVRKTRSGASSSGSSTKPSLSSRLDNLKISTIRQHYYPEGGWGWVICACAFSINMLTYGLLLSYGIFSREVVKEFGEQYSEQAGKWNYKITFLSLLINTMNDITRAHHRKRQTFRN